MDRVSEAWRAFEARLEQRDREVALLHNELERCHSQRQAAEERVAMLQAALDRQLAHESRDDAGLQRLIADLAEASARRKEQAEVIDRRNRQVIELKKQVDELRRGNVFGVMAGKLKRAFSRRRA
ncbi:MULTISPECIES: hypothetical protein [unclassified Sphingobium]|uniref:hypothetical protein n=1 Tax=unclassified Sphingobium TaxID=2611147 RepID=UPI0022253F5B|nr:MULTISPECIES: hypothetical protein [unclassified Sphingobium]MCW2411757.1 DNA repair exonuclease SbcCD ATPase subunit [Sphingobium sp. B8D3D]MCW2415947.1 DNA repair exonuclease SbcCD ATPase subunit [Sphingobium sp. B8D3A]